MPIITFGDEKLLAKIDVEVAKAFDDLTTRVRRTARAEKALGEEYQAYGNDLKNYVRKMRDKSKQMEILAREKRSGVSSAEVDVYKEQIKNVDERIKGITNFYDSLKDLAIQKKSLIERMAEYKSMVIDNAKLRVNLVDLGIKIDKEKNKMVAADSLSKLEDRHKDVQREFDRSKKEMGKKWDQIQEERSEVNKMWRALRDCIDDFS